MKKCIDASHQSRFLVVIDSSALDRDRDKLGLYSEALSRYLLGLEGLYASRSEFV